MAILQADVTSNTVILSKSEQVLNGEASITLSNTSGRDLSVAIQLLTDKPKAMEWVSFPQDATAKKPLTRLDETFRIGETRQYSVKISVPASAEPGSYAIRMRAAEDSLPDENWVESPSIVFEVAQVPQPKKAFPWWIIAVVLAVLFVVGGVVAFLVLRPDGDGEVTPTPTVTPSPTLTQTSTAEPTQTSTPDANTGDITFAALPDGTLIDANHILSGDEFAAAGITLSGAPEAAYCADAVLAAIRLPAYNVPTNFLTTASPGEINRCNTIPVAIRFNSPVRRVALTFYGASVSYTLKAYDTSNTLIGSEDQTAVYGGGDFVIIFQSGSANIKYVTFGHQSAVTAVTRIRFEK